MLYHLQLLFSSVWYATTMFSVPQKQFEDYVADALDSLPQRYQDKLNNILITVEDEPSADQRTKLHLHEGVTLFGLYEGVPLTHRGGNYSGVVPDKITIFKIPTEASVNTDAELKEQIRHTVWHEVAHYYGLDHFEISKRDS